MPGRALHITSELNSSHKVMLGSLSWVDALCQGQNRLEFLYSLGPIITATDSQAGPGRLGGTHMPSALWSRWPSADLRSQPDSASLQGANMLRALLEGW